ncbi:hypothetical protein [Actinophytocola oryzae]|uniref:Uncharacterized protein n=1 Tax=Actinophytocola oryzae TaxID=502181 RepID=A0A4R7URU1_9PSEU|nr:hypothetical protein [Actinophytocola oryzae]TDV35319.1 hypothetical protein CLV71_13634 [Actinophytocola oryzae]
MSGIPEGAQVSEDGHWWWDGSAWQAVEDAWDTVQEAASDAWDWATGNDEGGTTSGGGASGSYDDGDLAPEHAVCSLGPCPSCAESDQVSAPCVLESGHDSVHQCAQGDYWEQSDASEAALPLVFGTPVATAMLTYDSGSDTISATGNTTGWPRGTIDVVGDIYCDGQVVHRQENTCRSATACTLPTWSTTPDPGTRWEHVVTGSGPRYGPVEDTEQVDVP